MENKKVDNSRREFLKNTGKYAVVAPVALTAVMKDAKAMTQPEVDVEAAARNATATLDNYNASTDTSTGTYATTNGNGNGTWTATAVSSINTTLTTNGSV